MLATFFSIQCSSAPAPKSAAGPEFVIGFVQHLIGKSGTVLIPIIELDFGNLPQKVRVLPDTGSCDLVVPQTCSAICDDPQQQYATNGNTTVTTSFDAKNSTRVIKFNTPGMQRASTELLGKESFARLP
jgi:hypothetical protein